MNEQERRDVVNTIIAEALGEGDAGMAAVVWAMQNRADVRNISLADVVRQPGQFDGFSKPGAAAIRAQGDPAIRARVEGILDDVVSRKIPDPTGGADHFISGRGETSWTRAYDNTATIGGHRFYSSPQAAERFASPPRRVEPSMPTPMDPAMALSRQMNSGERTAPAASFYDGLFPAPPMPTSSATPFRPFAEGERVENADGSYSTERTITWQTPDGQWVNTPTLFKTAGSVLDLSAPEREAEARNAASALMRSGQSFPTFQTLEEAERAAAARSDAGGASNRAPITDRDLIRSSGISDTVRNAQAQQDPALAAALQSRIATAQRSSAPPMPVGVAQSYAGQERTSAASARDVPVPPSRPHPPMPTAVAQSYARQEALPPRIAPPAPPAAPSVQTAQVPAGMPTNTRSRDSAAQAAQGRATVASLQAPPIPGPNAPAKSQERLAAGVYPMPPIPIPNVAAAPPLNVVPDVGVATLLSVRPPMPRVPATGFPTSAALRPGQALPAAMRAPMPAPRAATGFPTPLSQRPLSSAPRNIRAQGGTSSGRSSGGGSSSERRYVMEGTGREVRPETTSIYNPDTNQFEDRIVYR